MDIRQRQPEGALPLPLRVAGVTNPLDSHPDDPTRSQAVGPVPRRATIYDVARHAHVSHQTVSRVLNDRPGVSSDTRELVVEAMRTLRFSRNTHALELSSPSSASRRLGVLVEQLAETGPSGNTVAALAELQAAGFQFDLATVNDRNIRDSVIDALSRLEKSTSGVLALAQTFEARAAIRELNLSVPIYVDEFLDRGTREQPGVEELIGRAAADHLAATGHRRVLHIPGPIQALAAGFRRDAFVEHAQALGLSVDVLPPGDWTSQSGFDRARSVRQADATGVFVANDAMALGLLFGLRSFGTDVPGDIAVLGADDISEARHSQPPLSSVRHDLAGEGRLAAAVLLAAVQNETTPDPRKFIDVRVIARASTGGHRDAAD